ncbi:hypothetical protein AX15_007262 [Amanita polypyramis BW_CC]|nr:hypothetical protein AX15_007262 [Amanita polypyramis BW_CC]
MVAAAALGLFLILPFDPEVLNSSHCLADSFYGNYRDGHILRSLFRFTQHQRSCFDSYPSTTTDLENSYKIVTQYEPQQLIWLEAEVIDANLQPQEQFNPEHWLVTALDQTNSRLNSDGANQQRFHSRPKPRSDHVIWTSTKATLMSVDLEMWRVLDMQLPRFWKSTLIPSNPTVYHPVPSPSEDHVQRIVSQLHFNPVIASAVNNISLPQMKDDIRFLTGEDGESGIVSRHSFSPGALVAANWLKGRFEEMGATCELKPFLSGFAPNIICRYNALEETDSIVILGAHYDSRGSFGFVRAPGGNDDGSGSISLLSIARTIARKGIKFRSNVQLCLFAGEEQGLLGSKAHAWQLKEEGANVTLMIQADMLAYRAFQEPSQIGIPDLIGSPAAAELVTKVAAIYSPELRVGLTPVCCSDHQSFHEQGYVATQLFERAGPIMDPMYHNSGDLSEREGYDFDQLQSIAKVQFAALLHIAGYEMA